MIYAEIDHPFFNDYNMILGSHMIHPRPQNSHVLPASHDLGVRDHDVCRRDENMVKVQEKSLSELVVDALVAYSPGVSEWSAKQSCLVLEVG
ncbi:MAG: hypothetical protein ACK4MY_06390 [Brevundimonas sp.]